MKPTTITVIGRAEMLNIPLLGLKRVPAKVDTGADASSIWCGKIVVADNQLQCVFFGKGSPFYTGKKVTFDMDDVELTRVANSFGHKEIRYKIKLPVVIKGRKINATFTLTDRSTKLYPVLIGRSLLKNKFFVDVSKGTPLHEEENERLKRLRKEMRRMKKELKV
jgi:hypothetical protein